MAQALSLMRNKGMLGDNSIEYTGRNKDKLLHKEMAKFEENNKPLKREIVMEYRDAYGRQMT